MNEANKIRVFLVHGWEGSPDGNWFPWLTKLLDKKHFSVTALLLPDPDHPQCNPWIQMLTKTVGKPDDHTILVGHSLGCITILRYLESLKPNEKILAAILVAGFSEPIGYEEIEHFFQPPLNYDNVKQKARAFVAIQSDDDPYVPFARGITMNEKLGATIIPVHNAGHIGAEDGYTELPEALEIIKDVTKKLIY